MQNFRKYINLVNDIQTTTILSDTIPVTSGMGFAELDRLSEGAGSNFEKFDKSIKKNLKLNEHSNTLEMFGYYLRYLLKEEDDSATQEDISPEEKIFNQFKDRTRHAITGAQIGDKVALLNMSLLKIAGAKTIANLSGFLTPKEITQINNQGNHKQLIFADGTKFPNAEDQEKFEGLQTEQMTRLFDTEQAASKAYIFYGIEKNNKNIDGIQFSNNVKG